MPISSIWYFNRRVLYIQFDVNVSPEDVDRFEAQLQLWQSKGIHPLHLIVNHRNLHSLPENGLRVQALLQEFACEAADVNCGWNLQVGAAMTLGSLVHTWVQQMRRDHTRTRNFETVGAALAFLREQDPVLPGLLLTAELA